MSSAVFSGIMYLIVGIIPLIIGLIGSQLYPEFYQANKGNFISALILNKTPVWMQILFFGALISAILSTASGALLAPATVLAENIWKPYFKQKSLLISMRWSVLVLALISILLAFNNQSIFELVSLASSFGLVSLFFPFTFTLFVPFTTSSGVIAGMLLGIIAWIVAEIMKTEIPSIFYGMTFSLFGILSGYIYQEKTSKA